MLAEGVSVQTLEPVRLLASSSSVCVCLCVSQQLPCDPNRKIRELSGSLLCVSALNFLPRPKPPSLSFHLLAILLYSNNTSAWLGAWREACV